MPIGIKRTIESSTMKCVIFYFLLIVMIILSFKSGTPAKEVYKSMDKQERIIFDFKNSDKIEDSRIVNDGVMGGLSRSKIVYTDSNTAIFKGTVSLENKGGFASTRTILHPYNLDGHNGILLRVKGDGKIYQFRLRTNNRFDGVSYRYQFATDAIPG